MVMASLHQVRLGVMAKPSPSPNTNADSVYRKYQPLPPPLGWLQPKTTLLLRSANLTSCSAVHNKAHWECLGYWYISFRSTAHPIPPFFVYACACRSFVPITPIRSIPKPCGVMPHIKRHLSEGAKYPGIILRVLSHQSALSISRSTFHITNVMDLQSCPMTILPWVPAALTYDIPSSKTSSPCLHPCFLPSVLSRLLHSPVQNPLMAPNS